LQMFEVKPPASFRIEPIPPTRRDSATSATESRSASSISCAPSLCLLNLLDTLSTIITQYFCTIFNDQRACSESSREGQTAGRTSDRQHQRPEEICDDEVRQARCEHVQICASCGE